MPTSHRAARPARRVKPWLAGIAVVVIVVSIALSYALEHNRKKTPTATPPTASPSATVLPSASPTPSTAPPSTPTSQSSPKKKAPKKPAITAVPSSPPHEISIGTLVEGAGFGNAISATNGTLFPDGATDLQRLESRGTPGSPGEDTVVIVGAANDHGTGVLDDLDQVATGETIVLTTRTGVLTYRITELVHASPGSVLALPQVSAHVPGRLVIDRADYVDHNRTGQDLVVIAQLTKAQPASL